MASLDHKRELHSGLIRLHVLHHACQEPASGLGMIEELGRHGYRLSPGTMYPLLRGLERQGLLHSQRQLVAGKLRCVYRATPAGRRTLRLAKLRVQELQELFGELFEDEPTTPRAVDASDARRDDAPGTRRRSFPKGRT